VSFSHGCDVQTSDVFELLNAGRPVVQALCSCLAPEEHGIVDDAVVPQLMLS
jgi:hypothetical protein